MLETLDSVEWDTLPQPSWNGRGEVPHALRALASVASEQEAYIAYHRVLYSLGNNHAGTYYPVAVSAVPFLGQIVAEGTPLQRQTALDILVDLMGSFEPEREFSSEQCPGHTSLRSAMFEAGVRLKSTVERYASSASACPCERSLALELLMLLSEPLEDDCVEPR